MNTWKSWKWPSRQPKNISNCFCQKRKWNNALCTFLKTRQSFATKNPSLLPLYHIPNCGPLSLSCTNEPTAERMNRRTGEHKPHHFRVFNSTILHSYCMCFLFGFLNLCCICLVLYSSNNQIELLDRPLFTVLIIYLDSVWFLIRLKTAEIEKFCVLIVVFNLILHWISPISY